MGDLFPSKKALRLRDRRRYSRKRRKLFEAVTAMVAYREHEQSLWGLFLKP